MSETEMYFSPSSVVVWIIELLPSFKIFKFFSVKPKKIPKISIGRPSENNKLRERERERLP